MNNGLNGLPRISALNPRFSRRTVFRNRPGFLLNHPVSVAVLVIMILFVIPLTATAELPDKQDVLDHIDDACPAGWSGLFDGFIGDESAVADPWHADATDQAAFKTYLQSELSGEALSQAELDTMAADPMAIIAECSYQKLVFYRLMALQAAEAVALHEGLLDFGVSSLAVPDGSTQALAAESCALIEAAYPNSTSGTYWIDADGGDTGNAVESFCVFGTPDGSSQGLAAESCAFIESAYPDSTSGTYWIDADGGDTSNAVETFCLFGAPDGSTQQYAASSCKQIHDAYPAASSGAYWIDVNGADTGDAYQAWCDMDSEGGGWTLVAAQFEDDDLTDWDKGIQSDYDPTLATSKSFTLKSSELPAHSETAFGKGLEATYVDYVDFVYVTSHIDKTLLSGKKTGKSYHIHRNSGDSYRKGDPEDHTETGNDSRNSLTFDETGGKKETWWYRPRDGHEEKRGYYMLGKTDSSDTYAWTVWVR